METIGKGLLVFMLFVKSLSPTLGNRVPTSGNYVPDPNRPAVIRVAVIPFENVSNDANATDRLSGALLTYLLHTQVVGVVDPTLVEQQLFNMKIRKASEITLKVAAELKQNLGVDAIILGRITAYQVDNSGGDSIPVIAVTARMLDLDTLGIMWSSSIVRKGNDKAILFDVGRIDTLSDLNQLVANDLASSLGKDVNGVLKGYIEVRNRKPVYALPPLSSNIVPAPVAVTAADSAPASPVASAASHEKTSLPEGYGSNKPVGAQPTRNIDDMLVQITDYDRSDLRKGKNGFPYTEATYYKGGTPMFISIADCGEQSACESLRNSYGAQKPGPNVNGDESTEMVSKMGMVTLSVVRGRYLMRLSSGEAMVEDMRVAGKEILKVMGR